MTILKRRKGQDQTTIAILVSDSGCSVWTPISINFHQSIDEYTIYAIWTVITRIQYITVAILKNFYDDIKKCYIITNLFSNVF